MTVPKYEFSRNIRDAKPLTGVVVVLLLEELPPPQETSAISALAANTKESARRDKF
jgi:hypothetical protein